MGPPEAAKALDIAVAGACGHAPLRACNDFVVGSLSHMRPLGTIEAVYSRTMPPAARGLAALQRWNSISDHTGAVSAGRCGHRPLRDCLFFKKLAGLPKQPRRGFIYAVLEGDSLTSRPWRGTGRSRSDLWCRCRSGRRWCRSCPSSRLPPRPRPRPWHRTPSGSRR